MMIEYDMVTPDNTNFENARNRFRHFLAHKCNIAESSVEVQGIVSGSHTWYIMTDTPALKNAIGPETNESVAHQLASRVFRFVSDNANVLIPAAGLAVVIILTKR